MIRIKAIAKQVYDRLVPYSLRIWRWCKEHYELTAIIVLLLVGIIDYHLPAFPDSLQKIKNKGVLTILASNEPIVQHKLSDRYYGFEYDLIAEYADSIGVETKIISVPYGELFKQLNYGKADIAIGGILNTSVNKEHVATTIEWYQLTPTITYHRKQSRVKNIQQLGDNSVHVSSRFLDAKLPETINFVTSDKAEYKLLSLVNNGSVEYALSSNYKAKQAKHYFPNLNRAFLLADKLDLVWALPKWHDKVLLDDIDAFLKKAIKQKKPEKYAEKYLENYKSIPHGDLTGLDKRIETVLPWHKILFKNAAREAGIDWYVLAAVAYQESHWSNKVTSPTGVRGIMQLTKETASYLGVQDRLNQKVSIFAAARYIKDLHSRLPEEIKEPDRTWFALAAYNAGLTHITRAYEKAKRMGLDATDWQTVANQSLIYLYSDNNEKTFSQGLQAQKYVDRIQVFTDILRFHSIHPEL